MFVSTLSSSALDFASKIEGDKLESDEKLFSSDLICEGPIEGIVDKNGDLMKYINYDSTNQAGNICLGKGLYFNDIPLIDSKTDKFNFSTAGFKISYGEEYSNFNTVYPSTIFKYNQKIYLNEENIIPGLPRVNGFFCFYLGKNNDIIQFPDGVNSNYSLRDYILGEFENNLAGVVETLDYAKINSREFTHKINNKYCDLLKVQIRLDSLFNTDSSGNILPTTIKFAIELSEDNSSERFFCITRLYGISKGGAYTLNIPIELNLDSVNKNNYYVKVYPLSRKINPTDGRVFREFSVSSIIESVTKRGQLCHPFSSLVKSAISSKHFNQDPNRTFDLKLLKIKVPNNYDPESKEYDGNWNGKFDGFLRWTDNPAWIFYDICTNSRYGVGNGNIIEKDLNKWELYKIAKYCDSLIKTSYPLKYTPDSFQVHPTEKNVILIDKKDRDLSTFKKQYPPVLGDQFFSTQNGGLQNSILYLFDLKNDGGDLEENYKKIIWSVDEVDSNGNATSANNGSYYKIRLINDFGPRKIFEKEPTGNLLQSFIDRNVAPSFSDEIDNNNIRNALRNSLKNTQSQAKSFILRWLNENKNSIFANNLINSQVFPESYYSKTEGGNNFLSGSCSPKSLNFRDALEPRFVANVLIDNESESLKILNDIASIFRGLTYYKNNFITATIDVDKPVSYIFNNTNVKDGLFNYSSGSVDGNYSVAKVLYKDQYNNFIDEVEIVEDAQLIKDYGIVIKEILGFGITSRDQARRIGLWLLSTNRFENQTVTFTTDLQGLLLKPSDVIQVEDIYKNDFVLQGRVLSVDYDGGFITVDRKLSLDLIGEKIKFLFDSEYLYTSSIIDSSQVDNLNIDNTVELKIERIENDTNNVYISNSYNYKSFNKVLTSSPFIIRRQKSNQQENLYKIVTISENDTNEYSIFCIKHNPNKYSSLDKNVISDNFSPINNSISFSDSLFLKELDLTQAEEGASNFYYEIIPLKLSDAINSNYDYSFNEQESSLSLTNSADKNYYILNLSFSSIKQYINNNASGQGEDNYFVKVKNVLDNGGGFICKLTLRNQSIKFNIPGSNVSDRKVFLGKFISGTDVIYPTTGIKIYLYNANNQIIEV